MTNAEKLKQQREQILRDRREQRDRFVAARQEAEQKLVEARAALDKKQAAFEQSAASFDSEIATLDHQIREAVMIEKKQQLLEVAAQIDQAETPEKWARFDRLCSEIPNRQSYELRSMNRRRMIGDKDVAALGRPYPNVQAWAAAMTGVAS
jgi:hypothetical protein